MPLRYGTRPRSESAPGPLERADESTGRSRQLGGILVLTYLAVISAALVVAAVVVLK